MVKHHTLPYLTDSHTIYTPHNIYGTQVHRYTVTEVQRYRGTEVQRYRGTGTGTAGTAGTAGTSMKINISRNRGKEEHYT